MMDEHFSPEVSLFTILKGKNICSISVYFDVMGENN